jgi:Tfp pilus tip-associated adhesin PilY1
MFTSLSVFFRSGVYRFKIVLVLVVLTFVSGAHGDPIIQNKVEDLKVISSQFVGDQPNVLTILDLSGSMSRNQAKAQLGNWDDSTVQDCARTFGTNSDDNRARTAHCAENVANTSVCGSKICGNGTCSGQAEFDEEVACVLANAPSGFNPACIYDRICGNNDGNCNETSASCNTSIKRERAAAAIEAAAGLTQCSGASNCKTGSDTDPSCNTSTDYSRFTSCMANSQAISINKTENCSVTGNPDCKGQPQSGSSRIDMALDVFFSFLDADDSLASKSCDDPNKLFNGVSTSISCQDYMETPFRDVNAIVKGTGTNFRLPITNGSDTPLIDELTDNDAKILGIRFRPMTYSGVGNWSGCTSNSTFRIAQGGFAGQSKADLDNVWKFYRGVRGDGGTPLAYVLGFDDSNASNSTIPNDALGAYKVELQTDPSIACRPEFVIVITDGEDTCSGQCSVTSGSCSGSVTTNANRRSSIQAVSNLRTYYARNPVSNGGSSFKKEILTFVIGIGIEDPAAVRTLNAMALAGGTHTTGIIRHRDPNGQLVGSIDINGVLPSGGAFQVFKDLGEAKGIDTNPSNAQLQGCKSNQVNENGICSFQGINVFDNSFFDTGAPFTSENPLNGFAFFASNPEELAQALHDILELIRTFSTVGVSPAAPQSSTSVALRDRIFLSILTPITSEPFWQGRLALYGFVDDPDNPGAKIVVDTNQEPIFNPDTGALTENAANYHWEAGKKLAERDLSGDPRNLFTVDPNTREVDSTGAEIRYTAGGTGFNKSLSPDFFGISDADVVAPIPDFCTAEPPDGIDDCSTSCVDINSATCKTCVKSCMRDKIVEFMSGNTGILPVGDPLGPIGTDCPDPSTGTGSLATCSVRLGDIFHSTPLVVGSPSPLFFDVGFQNFAAKYRDRTAVVYVGANDGFLHAFNAGGKLILATPSNPERNPFTNEDVTVPFFNEGDGRELFGFAPPSFLHDSLSTHGPETPSGFTPDYRFGDFKTFVTTELQTERSFFDGSPLVADVFIDGSDNGIPEDASCSGAVDTPDGEIDLCGREWHSILLSGYRNGGGAYVALDVTNAKCDKSTNGLDECNTSRKHLNNGPDYPTHLWTVFDKNFGNTWSDPTIGRVRMQTVKDGNQTIVDRWVMFVGGGLHPTDIDPTDGLTNPTDIGNAFYAIDIATGKIIFKYARDASAAPNATLTDPRMVCDMPAKVGAFDLNADGYIDVVYEGDTCGRLWRFDVSMPIVDNGNDITETGIGGSATFSAPDWTGDIAFCANTSTECNKANNVPTTNVQPIFFAPTAVLDDLGKRHVIFTTGNRRDPSNVNQFGKLYNFIDDFIPAFLAGGIATSVPMKTEANFTSGQILDLVPQSGVSDQFTTQGGGTINNQGEFIVRFPDNVSTPKGEKGFGSPAVVNRVLIFTTFAPTTGQSTDPCIESAGSGRIFALDYLSGEPALVRIPGAQGIIQGSSSQKQAAAGLTVAEGMPTPAQLTFGARGSVVLTVAFSGSSTVGGAQFLVWELPPFPTRTQTLFWEEIL